MSRTHVVVGAGIVGSTLAELLANDGQDVIVITR
jgi:flavin-dependent dehydrogenase